MLNLYPDKKVFSEHNIDEFVVPPKPTDTRGFIYIVLDSVFPNEFKIGVTINVKKRLQQYNSDKPYKTATMHQVSRMFADSVTTEKQILEALYKRTPPTTFSKEWFPIEFLNEAVYLVEEAEKEFL